MTTEQRTPAYRIDAPAKVTPAARAVMEKHGLILQDVFNRAELAPLGGDFDPNAHLANDQCLQSAVVLDGDVLRVAVKRIEGRNHAAVVLDGGLGSPASEPEWAAIRLVEEYAYGLKDRRSEIEWQQVEKQREALRRLGEQTSWPSLPSIIAGMYDDYLDGDISAEDIMHAMVGWFETLGYPPEGAKWPDEDDD